jgi:2-methylfumaryl-CoA isomerase
LQAPILAGLRVVELSAFVAAPLAGATLAGMGADVIRVDPLGGGIDIGRWPLWEGGSLYWAGLNQGKRSVTLDTRSARGRELVAELVVKGGPGGGIVLTNLPVEGWLRFEELRARRPDVIMVVISGSPDGAPAVDYTVNAGMGFPWVTGPEGHAGPVNHVLPAWDALTGYLTASAVLAAERQRSLTGEGQLVRLSLFDVALAVSGHLGLLAEAQLDPTPRPRVGNHLYGTFAHDFETADGRHLIVCALTPRQWSALVEATGSQRGVQALEESSGEDLREEGARYRLREEIVALLGPWFSERTLAEAAEALEGAGVLWGPYRTFQELVREDPRASTANAIVAPVAHPRLGTWRAAGSPVAFGAAAPVPPRRGPVLGEHTVEVLRDLLELDDTALGALRRERVIDQD